MDSIKELCNKIDRFNKDRNWDQFHTPENLAKSITIEASELLECFQWNASDYDQKHVEEELADVINYCLQLSMVLGVDVKNIVLSKIQENEKKYPVDKSRGVITKYDKL